MVGRLGMEIETQHEMREGPLTKDDLSRNCKECGNTESPLHSILVFLCFSEILHCPAGRVSHLGGGGL